MVKAGLIPALRRGGLLGSEEWFIVDLMPGAHPLEELEAALLRIAVNPPESLLAQLGEDERGLVRAVRRVLPADPNVELVLVIDQFEEVFTQVTDEQVRAHFLDSLVEAVLDERSRVRVVVTLRADFTGRALEYVDFGELVRHQTAFVLPLTPDELEQAIVEPAARSGLAVEPGLVATIVQDVGDQPGLLPLLQYALTKLFEQREGRTLTLAAYQESGGVTGALGRRAEELHTGLEEAAQEAARQLFLRLVTLGEGIEDTRRRVLRTELETLEVSETSRVLDAVIDQYGRYRLLTFDHDPATRGPTVEVAHEALLREWGRLRSWLDESRADVRMQRLLAAATGEWDGAGREASYLLRGARLAQFEGWAEGSAVALTQDERAYLETSTAEWEARQTQEAERQRRELETVQRLAEAEKRRAEEQTRSATKLRQRAIGLAIALIVATIAAVAALDTSNRNATLAGQNADIASTAQAERAVAQTAQAQEAAQRATAQAAQFEAEDARTIALSRQLAAQSANQLNDDNWDMGLLLAVEAGRTGDTAEAYAALRRAFAHPGRTLAILSGHTGKVVQAVWNSDESRTLTAGIDGTARVWDAETGAELFTLSGHTGEVVQAVWNPDESRILTRGRDDTVRVWDAETGAELFTLSGHTDSVWQAAWNSDGSHILTTSSDGTARVWDAETGVELVTLSGHTDLVHWAVWNSDESRIMTASYDGTARVWDAGTGGSCLSYLVTRIISTKPCGTPMRAAS